MKMKLNVGIATAGIAVVLLAGCVSSKKYKSAEAVIQKMKEDSAQLAQQISSLNASVQSLQDKNNAIQRSLDSSTNSYAAQQKNLGYYQDYFKQQQTNASQMSDALKGALSQAGVTNGDVQQVNNTIYVRLDENTLFKKNSTTVTTSGKQALSSLAQVIKNQNDVNVFVNDGDSSSGQGGMATTSSSSSTSTTGNATTSDNTSGNATADNTSASDNTASAAPRHHRTHRTMSSHKSTMGNDEKSTASASTSHTAATDTTPGRSHVAHHRTHHKYSSEGSSMTYYSNMGKSSGNRSWMLKQRRMGIVANSFLASGLPKVNVTMKQPDMNGTPNNNIAVVIVPKMSDFNPQTGTSSAENK